MAPLTVADLVFSSEQANHNFSRILGDLKRANLSITNRLRSIRRDANFVAEVAAEYAADSGGRALPLVANERCGSWYIPPERKAASAYFKSTDGHTGQWKFSTRRLNLHLLELIGRCDGCIIVDSTRRGKSMPDALSKTIPTWCCVLNRALFPDGPDSAHKLFLPSSAVSASEKSQIEARIPDFVDSFQRLRLDLASLRKHVTKPLRPAWRTPSGEYGSEFMFEEREAGCGFHPVVCCTSSRRIVAGQAEMSEPGYVQGAGDDTENWALGLTAPIFWAHSEELLAAPEADLPDLIARLVAESGHTGENVGAEDAVNKATLRTSLKRLTPYLSVTALSVSEESLLSGTCLVSLMPKTTEPGTWLKSKNSMEVGLGKGKFASRTLRDGLPQICEAALQFLQSSETLADEEDYSEKQLVVACETGKDLSVGVALALDCWCFDDQGKVRQGGGQSEFTKSSIRIRLARIMTAMPEANPSRTTLQSVNSFLMDWRR